ncbi:N-methyl-L-tryptophan oxidase [Salinarimonas soli]|uniref:N-methyl-L-tryptophan oxidase n=1 Tax=Salinarimonas soli TaxID=1638099 RepID=A0A5B2VF89_9HYPH|nr:N-methyl-L-tryptophan oxidase [Salinarimonas soli]KAA2237781.1 N-methyl-L-tryptophan oxidase [Salinarimonas soli]
MVICDVAVIGLGAMGSAAAYHLARRGKRVVGIEQFEPGHDRGSSHGESRIIRLAYFEHPSYVPLLRRAYALWRDLERASGEAVMTITGILEAGHPGSAVVEGSLSASKIHDLTHEVLDAREIGRRFPAFRLPEGWSGVFQPDGGFLRPELAIRLHCAGARAAGADLRVNTRVLGIEPTGAGVRVVLDDGTIVEAGAVVVATGAWMADLMPSLTPHLRLTRQVLGWFEPRQPELFASARFPVFIVESEQDAIYGFPDFKGTGVKAASHMAGEVLTSAYAQRPGDAADEARIRDSLERLIPAANGPLRRMQPCIYTRTLDEDFVVDLHPGDPRIVVASPCSGHGFKFSSAMGEVLADLALKGGTDHDISRFRIDRLLDQGGARSAAAPLMA